MHQATSYDTNYVRHMHRTTIEGGRPFNQKSSRQRQRREFWIAHVFDPRTDGMKPAPFNLYIHFAGGSAANWLDFTIDIDGVVNLAPFSYFNAIAADPPCLMYCPNGPKRGRRNQGPLSNAEMTKNLCLICAAMTCEKNSTKPRAMSQEARMKWKKQGLPLPVP